MLKTAEGAVYAQPQPEQPIAADGWFSLLGLASGCSRRSSCGSCCVGCAGRSGWSPRCSAPSPPRRWPGRWAGGSGLATFDRLLASAPEGRAFSKPADLRAGGVDWLLGVLPVPHGNLLLPAFGAAVTYTLLAGWSRWPSLRPEPEPDPAAFSWASAGTPAPTAAPEPPAPGAAEPPRG